MVFSYSKSKEEKKLVFNMNFDPDSTFSSTLLNNGDFSKLILRDDGIQITVPEEKLALKQVEVRVDGVYQVLSLEPAIKTETKPTSLISSEKSSIEEIENRLSSQGILETSVERTVEKIEKPSTEEKAHAQYCPDCGSKNIIRDYDTSETVCSECGFVLPEKIFDYGPERAFDNEQRMKRTRAGAPVTYTVHDKGLSTMIDWHDRDYFGRGFSPGQKAQYYRLRKWQHRIRVADATERNLAFALSDLNKIGNSLNLPKSALETASTIYRKAVKDRKVRGRSIRAMVAASTNIACRQCGIPRTLNEVADASYVGDMRIQDWRKQVGSNFRFLLTEYGIKPPQIERNKLVSKYAEGTLNKGKIEYIANKTLFAAKQNRTTSGKGPEGLSAAAIYIGSVLTGERKTQRELAEIAGVTEVTIRNRYKTLANNLTFEMTL